MYAITITLKYKLTNYIFKFLNISIIFKLILIHRNGQYNIIISLMNKLICINCINQCMTV